MPECFVGRSEKVFENVDLVIYVVRKSTSSGWASTYVESVSNFLLSKSDGV